MWAIRFTPVKHDRARRYHVRTGWRRATVVIVAPGMVLSHMLLASPAAAINFSGPSGGTGCGLINMQDNTTMNYYRDGLTTKMQSAVGLGIGQHRKSPI